MAEPTPRTLLKQISGTVVSLNYDSEADALATNGWEVLWNTFPYITNRTYIDLGGYTIDDLTTFVGGVDFQTSLLLKSLSTGIPEITQLDILSTRRITDAEINNWALPTVTDDPPGFLDNTVDLMEVVYGERTTFGTNTAVTGVVGLRYITLQSDTWGSGNAVASDRLHWTRVYWVNGSGADENLYIPAANLVCKAATAKESDLVYIERLRRAYTQQRSES
jgi:hypothetical protein